jgi:hypothetical protein
VLGASDTNRKCQWIPSAELFALAALARSRSYNGHEDALLAPQSTSSLIPNLGRAASVGGTRRRGAHGNPVSRRAGWWRGVVKLRQATGTLQGPITVCYAICRNHGVERNTPSYEPAHLRSVALRTACVDKALHETNCSRMVISGTVPIMQRLRRQCFVGR